MTPLIEMLWRRQPAEQLRRLRRLLARHVSESNPNPGREPSLAVQVLAAPERPSVSATAKQFFDVSFCLVASEPLPDRPLIIGITTGQIRSLFKAESGEASFLGGRLWQTEVVLTEIIEGAEYARLSALLR
jgi:hypothetical protein